MDGEREKVLPSLFYFCGRLRKGRYPNVLFRGRPHKTDGNG